MSKEVKLRWEGFVEKVGLSLEWKSEGVMDAESGDDDKDALTSEEVNQDRTVKVDEMNLEVDSKDEAMHI